jgi:hypothetical protein
MTRPAPAGPLLGPDAPADAQATTDGLDRRVGRSERGPLKIGIVSPYGYPLPGGVNEHVRYTYEAMRRMGHDAWIITSAYGLGQPDEGHVIRLGYGVAVTAIRSHGRVPPSVKVRGKARR